MYACFVNLKKIISCSDLKYKKNSATKERPTNSTNSATCGAALRHFKHQEGSKSLFEGRFCHFLCNSCN
jgi:hypothetical protein